MILFNIILIWVIPLQLKKLSCSNGKNEMNTATQEMDIMKTEICKPRMQAKTADHLGPIFSQVNGHQPSPPPANHTPGPLNFPFTLTTSSNPT